MHTCSTEEKQINFSGEISHVYSDLREVEVKSNQASFPLFTRRGKWPVWAARYIEVTVKVLSLLVPDAGNREPRFSFENPTADQ